jgi:putative phosphoribosyl transferase
LTRVYRDRLHAGEVLAEQLARYADREDLTVLALPRGGIPVAFPIARALAAPLDILAVRKIGVPGHEELAMGAVAAGGVRVLNDAVITGLEIDEVTLDQATEMALRGLALQERRFRGDRPQSARSGQVAVLVDDGLATGSTMEAAIQSCRRAEVAGVVVAVPVGAPSTVSYLATLADDVVCPSTPAAFRAVGLAYRDFTPVGDEEVLALLGAANQWLHRP